MKKKKSFITIEKIFGESFQLYFRNILNFTAPIFLLCVVLGLFMYKYFNMVLDDPSYDFLESVDLGVYILSVFVLSFFSYLVVYFEMKIIANAYIDKSEPYLDILKESIRRIFPFFILILATTLLAMLGYLLLIVPGIILLLAWSVASNVFIVEKEKIGKSMKRSWELTKGNRGRIFLIFLMSFSALYFFMIFITIIIFVIIAVVTGGFANIDESSIMGGTAIAMSIGMALIYAIIYPILFSIMTVIYFNLRKEKEGFATELLADSFLEDSAGEQSH